MKLFFDIIIYGFLGFIQGFTEPIPVSSSGHLVIFQSLLNKVGVKLPTGDVTFEVIVNTGSLLAIMFFYRKDIVRIAYKFFGYIASKGTDKSKLPEFRFGILLIIATIPAGIGGVLLKDYISSAFSNVKLVGCTLLLTAIMLMLIHKYGYTGKRSTKKLNVFDALRMGFFQLLALLPGVSRSGSTITAGLLGGLDQKAARDFSFFMFMPVSLGAVILELPEFMHSTTFKDLWLPYLIAFIISIFTTYFALKLLFKIIKERKFNIFAVYCFIVGLITVFFIS